MNKAIPLSAAFVASAAISWMVASPSAPSPERRKADASAIPPRTPPKLTRAQADADPAYQGALDRIRSATTTKDRLQFTYDLAHSIPDEDVEKWLSGNLFREDGYPALVAFFRSILFGRYSAIDPGKCAVAMTKAGGIGLRPHLKRWAATDYPAVLALAAQTSDRNHRSFMLEAGLCEQAKTDPAAVLATLEREKDAYVPLDDIIAAFGASNRGMVLDWADHPRQEMQRSSARKAVTGAWMKEDFNAALSWAEQQEDAGSLLAYGLRYEELTPSGFLGKVGTLPPELLQTVLSGATKRGEYLDDWISYDYEGKAGLSAAQAKMVRFTAMQRLAFVDTRKALEAVKLHGLPDRGGEPWRFRSMVGEMNRGFEAMGGEVLEEWRKILGEDAEGMVRVPSSEGAPLNSPVPPADAIRQMGEAGKVSDTGFITRWSREEMAQAIDTLPSLTASQLENFNDLLDRSNGGAALEFHAAVLAEAAKKKAAFNEFKYADVGFRLAQRNPSTATRWALQMPEGDGRDLAIRGITAHMHADGPEVAEQWMAGLEPADRKAAEQVIHHIRTVHAND
ncbi:MAG: hypothetical protein EOP87_07585 [Verrucomicrobiaceae bacterium]|nr:MAG: hypothetical protein EOP87_07585 [Verrucomicrobiaceae bacterium]